MYKKIGNVIYLESVNSVSNSNYDAQFSELDRMLEETASIALSIRNDYEKKHQLEAQQIKWSIYRKGLLIGVQP